jgi:hypothetical protein
VPHQCLRDPTARARRQQTVCGGAPFPDLALWPRAHVYNGRLTREQASAIYRVPKAQPNPQWPAVHAEVAAPYRLLWSRFVTEVGDDPDATAPHVGGAIWLRGNKGADQRA